MTSRRKPFVPKGNSTIGVGVEIEGLSALQSAFARLLEPELTGHLDKANKKGAQLLGKELRREVKPLSNHMAKAVRVKRAKTGKPGWVVGSRRKIAFFWPFVIGGTKDHGPRGRIVGRGIFKRRVTPDALVFIPGWNPYHGASSKGVGNKWVRAKRVRGVKSNPAVDRVAQRHGQRALGEIGRQFAKDTKL